MLPAMLMVGANSAVLKKNAIMGRRRCGQGENQSNAGANGEQESREHRGCRGGQLRELGGRNWSERLGRCLSRQQ